MQSNRHSAILSRPDRWMAESEAPLWRNAPAVTSGRRRVQSPVLSSDQSFQQSLRCYPLPAGMKPVVQRSKGAGQRKRPVSCHVPHEERCFVTSLDSQQSGPFYLDYLEWPTASALAESGAGVDVPFDHARFMHMFRTQVQPSGTCELSSADTSLPYTVNEPVPATTTTISASQCPKRDHSAQPTTSSSSGRRLSAPSRPKDIATKDNVVLLRRNQSTASRNMERKGSPSSSRQNGSEKRAEKPGANSPLNPSLAFGSTRPRNIDLTRPLITPVATHTRPKSEIFTGSFFDRFGSSNAAPATVTDSPLMSQSCYSKPDDYPSPLSSSSPHQPVLRAARRHDPELVPALQKHVFRDFSSSYSARSPSGLKKDNSMISSMTSTKSFQNRSNNAFLQSRPKKSFSMNRLDQLAQPRRRVEPKVPTSASFVKPKETANRTQARSSSSTENKPTPPPKSFMRHQANRSVPNDSGGGGRRSAGSTSKQRPVSHYESIESPPAPEWANTDGGERNAEEEEKLAAYKRQMAEKRAQFRRMQEQRHQQKEMEPKPTPEKDSPARVVVRRKPEAAAAAVVPSAPRHERQVFGASGKSLADEIKEPLQAQPAEQKGSQLDPVATTDATTPSSLSSDEDSRDSKTLIHTDEQTASADDSDMGTRLENLSMNQSFDESDLPASHNPHPSAMSVSFDGSLLSSSTQSPPASTGHQHGKVLKHELERQKRKNRVLEILQRTRKDDKKQDQQQQPDSKTSSDADKSSSDDSLGDKANEEEREQPESAAHKAMNGNSESIDGVKPSSANGSTTTNGIHLDLKSELHQAANNVQNVF